jgi:hypothetical protein
MPFLGGYGSEFFGELLGSGGPINVQRAVAMAGQVVRVAFNVEPLNKSAAGLQDALNPANYAFGVVAGTAKVPSPTVAIGLVLGPGRGLGSTDVGIDMGVDTPLAAAVLYKVTVSGIISAMGGDIGTPASANFAGLVVPTLAVLPKKKPVWYDLLGQVVTGALAVDSGGDIAVGTDKIANLRKRVTRRLLTQPNAYAFLKNYGAGIALMETASLAEVANYRKTSVTQIQLEPEVASAQVQISISGSTNGVVTIDWSASLKTGEAVSGQVTTNAA